VAAVVEIGGGDTLRAGKRHGGGEQSGALHADTDDAEADTVAWSDGGVAGGFQARVSQEERVGGSESAGGTGGALQEFAAREILFHSCSWSEKSKKRISKAKIIIEEKASGLKPGLSHKNVH
jgi:hypothetical protein